MILLVDCGNTSSKWRLVAVDGRCLREHREVDGRFAVLLAELKTNGAALTHLDVYLSNVAGVQSQSSLLQSLNTLKGIPRQLHHIVVQREFMGLRVAYQDTRQLGVDRWLAMLAAYNQVRGALLLISLGTAVTVDKISANGEHLGGLIAPGWRLLKESLAERTAQLGLASQAELVSLSALGSDTRACLESGLSTMILGFISRVDAQFGKDVSSKIVTGGDAARVAPCLDGAYVMHSNLVLDGLQLFAFATKSYAKI